LYGARVRPHRRGPVRRHRLLLGGESHLLVGRCTVPTFLTRRESRLALSGSAPRRDPYAPVGRVVDRAPTLACSDAVSAAATRTGCRRRCRRRHRSFAGAVVVTAARADRGAEVVAATAAVARTAAVAGVARATAAAAATATADETHVLRHDLGGPTLLACLSCHSRVRSSPSI
jgi:hypothetical protein